MKNRNWRKYAFEFLSIFIAVISAFALDNWNENRREDKAGTKILTEISNGLQRDLDDIRVNVGGHLEGIAACSYWRRISNNQPVDPDSLARYYLSLTRDFISIQNVSGYETLKSKGLEIIKNDSLRFEIISLYEYDYNTLKKLEETYQEMQFQESYFKEINGLISGNFVFDTLGRIESLELPLNLRDQEKNTLFSYLWKIEKNRRFILHYYADIEKKIYHLRENIRREIN